MSLAEGTIPKEALLGTQTTKGQEPRRLRGEVQASCLVEVASELSLDGQKIKHSKNRQEGHSRKREQPGQRVGGGKVHSMCVERRQPAQQVRGPHGSRWAGQASGSGS